MPFQDAALVCLNGHVINTSFHKSPHNNEARCRYCGEETIHKCPNCYAEIKGRLNTEGVALLHASSSVASFCYNCGEPYPWKAKEGAKAARAIEQPTTPANLTLDLSGIGKSDDISLQANIKIIEQLATRFYLVTEALKDRHREKKDKVSELTPRETLIINDEYDVQDCFTALLKLFFADIRREETGPSHAGTRPRVDILLKGEQIFIEFKHAGNINDKDLSAQIILDKAYYPGHPDCSGLVVIIYNPPGTNKLKNPKGLIRDLSKPILGEGKNIPVHVFIIPE